MKTRSAIVSAAIDEKSVVVELDDQPAFAFHGLWLRDNCDCSACVHTESQQKVLSASDVPGKIRPLEAESAGNTQKVTWPGGHESLTVLAPTGNDDKKHA